MLIRLIEHEQEEKKIQREEEVVRVYVIKSVKKTTVWYMRDTTPV